MPGISSIREIDKYNSESDNSAENGHTIHRATHCISPRVTSLLRSFRAANR